MTAFVVGYDPGGNGKHGVAALRVRQEGSRWAPVELRTTTAQTLGDVVAWVEAECQGGRVVAAGVDTLTEWSTGPGGWRPADCWLRAHHSDAAPAVVAANSIYGAMAVNGAAFLTLLAPRLRADRTVVTEAHPKVAYFALTGRRPDWKTARHEMVTWLVRELGIAAAPDLHTATDDRFDAAMAALAALRGCNGEWTRDLHDLPDTDPLSRVRFCGPTHYWWPD